MTVVCELSGLAVGVSVAWLVLVSPIRQNVEQNEGRCQLVLRLAGAADL